MKKILTAALSCVAAHLIFILYMKLSDDGSSQKLNLWYVEGDISLSSLEALAESYNSQRSRDSYALSLQGFETEEALASAFETQRPDLLLCSYTRAASLGSRGQLGSVDQSVGDYLPEIEQALPFAGQSFFPIGSRVPILVFNTSVLEEAGISPDFENLESFISAAQDYLEKTGSPFFSASGLSPLLCTWSASLGYQLKGRPELDAMDEGFARCYNTLASAAMEGSFLPPGEDRLEMAAAGLLPCVFVDSPLLSELPEGLGYTTLPLPENGEAVYVPDIIGFAVTGANTYALPSVQAFGFWLSRSFSPESALQLGLVPAVSTPLSQESRDAGTPLADISIDFRQVIYPPLGEFAENREEMELSLCRALDLLY